MKLTFTPVLVLALLLGCAENAKDAPTGLDIVEETDSTLHLRAQDYEGILFKKNYSFLVAYDTLDNPLRATVLSHVPTYRGTSYWTRDPAGRRIFVSNLGFRSVALDEIAAFERSFHRYWQSARSDSLAKARGKEFIPYRSLHYLNRQYIGYTDSSGRDVLWVNLFNKAEVDLLDRWHTEPIQVDDGGWSFFNLKYDVEADSIYDIFPNAM